MAGHEHDHQRTKEPIGVLHVCDFKAQYAGTFIDQLKAIDRELKVRHGVRAGIVLPESVSNLDWFDDLSAIVPIFTVPDATTLRWRASIKPLRRIFESTGVSIVHTHFGTYDLAALKAVRGDRSRKLVWHFRTAIEIPEGGHPWTRKLKDYLKYRRNRKSVDAVFAVSRGVAQEAVRRGLGGLDRVVLSGIDVKKFEFDREVRQRFRAELGIAENEIMVLHFGWKYRVKGVDMLIDAVRELVVQGEAKNLRVFSVGVSTDVDISPRGTTIDGRPVIERLAMRNDIHPVFCASDIFLSLSRNEAFGNALVEAMACGRVAVAPMIDGHSEVFMGAGGVMPVPAEDPLSVAAAIGKLLAQQDNWERFGELNRSHVAEKFTLERLARDTVNEYERLGLAGLIAWQREAGSQSETNDEFEVEEIRNAADSDELGSAA